MLVLGEIHGPGRITSGSLESQESIVLLANTQLLSSEQARGSNLPAHCAVPLNLALRAVVDHSGSVVVKRNSIRGSLYPAVLKGSSPSRTRSKRTDKINFTDPPPHQNQIKHSFHFGQLLPCSPAKTISWATVQLKCCVYLRYRAQKSWICSKRNTVQLIGV